MANNTLNQIDYKGTVYDIEDSTARSTANTAIQSVKVNGTALTPDGSQAVDITAIPASIVSAGALANGMTATTQTTSDDSTKVATTAFVHDVVDLLPSPMVYKGTLGTGGTITTLPVDGTAEVGDTYKVITAGTYASQAAKVGDMFICLTKATSSNTWSYVPSGDDTDVTQVSAGTGLTTASGSPITTTGTIKAKLKSSTALAEAATNSTTTGKSYAVNVDSAGDLACNVPWTDTTYNFEGTYDGTTNKAATMADIKDGKLTGYTVDSSKSTIGATTKVVDAIEQLDYRTQTNENNISSIQQEQIVQNADIATLRLALDTKIYGIRIDKQDANPDTRVTYLYDAVGMTPAYMDFNSGAFNYGSWADIWFIKNNRPVALKFDGTVDYELDHTDFTKQLDGTASDVEDSTYAGNFMSEMPTVYVKRWEDSRYNYIAFSDKQVNSDFLAQAHTNANGTVNSAIYLPMFKGWRDSNNKLRSLMGTYPTGNTTGANEVTYASNNGTGWQIWDKAKIDLLMDLIMLITKSTNCRAKIGNGDCNTYNSSDTTNYGKMKSGYETDGTTRSTNAQFYGSEGTEVTNYGKHHMIAFYIEDLWANRWDRCLGFNLVDNVYKVKMTAPYVLNSDSSYETLTVTPPSSTEGWLKNVSSANAYGDVPTEVGANNTTGFANYFYKNASGTRLSLFGGDCNYGLGVGRYWYLNLASSNSYWNMGGSPCYNNPS